MVGASVSAGPCQYAKEGGAKVGRWRKVGFCFFMSEEDCYEVRKDCCSGPGGGSGEPA